MAVEFPAEFAGKRDADELQPFAGDLAGLVRQPRKRQVGVADGRQYLTRFRTGQDLARESLCDVFDSDFSAFRKMFRQPLEIVPLGHRGGDQEEEVLAERHHRHLGDDAALVVGKIGEADTAWAWNCAGDKRRQPLPGTVALNTEARKAGQIEDTGGIAHGVTFLPNALQPGAVAPERLRRGLRDVVAWASEPVGALPAIVGAELSAHRGDPVVDRRELPVAAGRPEMARKMNRIFVAVDLKALGDAIVGLGREGGEAARIAGPHVPFGRAFGDPLGKHLAGAAGLGDAEGEDAGFECVGDAGHRTDQRIAVRRVGDRPVYDLRQAGRAEQRDAPDGVFQIVLQPLQVVGEKLEREVFRHRIVGACPVGAAVALVGPKVHAVLFLAQIVGDVHVAQKRQLVAAFGGPRGQFGDFVEQDVLVAHHHHRNGPAEHAADLGRPVAGGVDDVFAADLAFRRLDDPFAALPAHSGDRAEADDRSTHVARALGQRLRELGRVDVAVIRVVECALQIVQLDEGIVPADVVRRQDVDRHALVAAHAPDALEFLHALARVGEADRAGDVIVHRIVDRRAEPAVELGRIALHVHD